MKDLLFFDFGKNDDRPEQPETPTPAPKKYPDRYTKEQRAAYSRAYRAKLKEKRVKQKLQFNPESFRVRFCRKCDAPTQKRSYFFCSDHNTNTSDKIND